MCTTGLTAEECVTKASLIEVQINLLPFLSISPVVNIQWAQPEEGVNRDAKSW